MEKNITDLEPHTPWRASSLESRPLPQEFHEPLNETSRRPHGPTPAGLLANCSASPAIYRSYAEANRAFDPLFTDLAPHDIPQETREQLVYTDYLAGDVQRGLKNAHSYNAWSQKGDPEFHELEEKLLRGTITASEALDLLQHSTLESAELAKVTHPYGYRLGYVADAREDVNQAIEDHGGIVIPAIGSFYRKIDFNQPAMLPRDESLQTMQLIGFRIPYKKDIGYITRPDGRRIKIIERQSAAIRIDSEVEGIPSHIKEALMTSYDGDHYDDWLCAIDRQTDFKNFFTEAIQNNTDADFLIPLSTMHYARAESDDEYQQRLKEDSDRLVMRQELKRKVSGVTFYALGQTPPDQA